MFQTDVEICLQPGSWPLGGLLGSLDALGLCCVGLGTPTKVYIHVLSNYMCVHLMRCILMYTLLYACTLTKMYSYFSYILSSFKYDITGVHAFTIMTPF